MLRYKCICAKGANIGKVLLPTVEGDQNNDDVFPEIEH